MIYFVSSSARTFIHAAKSILNHISFLSIHYKRKCICRVTIQLLVKKLFELSFPQAKRVGKSLCKQDSGRAGMTDVTRHYSVIIRPKQFIKDRGDSGKFKKRIKRQEGRVFYSDTGYVL